MILRMINIFGIMATIGGVMHPAIAMLMTTTTTRVVPVAMELYMGALIAKILIVAIV